MSHRHDTVQDLLAQFCRLFCRCHEPELRPQWTLALGNFAVTFTGEFTMNMKDDSLPVPLTVVWKDKLGKTAQVQGDTTFTSDNPDAVVVGVNAAGKPTAGPGPNATTPDADPVTGLIATATITASADADLGDGVTAVSAIGTVALLSGDASTGEITFGAPGG